jgi:hypothetical protein
MISNILPILLLIILGLAIRKAGNDLSLGILAASSGFMLMSIETLIIFMFQSKVGYLYSQICLIFAAALSGMAVGVKTAEYSKKHPTLLKIAFAADFVICVSLGVYAFTGSVLWFFTSFMLGIFGGLIFAVVNTMYLKKEGNPGYIYTYDLLGSSAGAILTGSWLLPVYGIRGLIIGLGVLMLFDFRLISKLRK